MSQFNRIYENYDPLHLVGVENKNLPPLNVLTYLDLSKCIDLKFLLETCTPSSFKRIRTDFGIVNSKYQVKRNGESFLISDDPKKTFIEIIKFINQKLSEYYISSYSTNIGVNGIQMFEIIIHGSDIQIFLFHKDNLCFVEFTKLSNNKLLFYDLERDFSERGNCIDCIVEVTSCLNSLNIAEVFDYFVFNTNGKELGSYVPIKECFLHSGEPISYPLFQNYNPCKKRKFSELSETVESEKIKREKLFESNVWKTAMKMYFVSVGNCSERIELWTSDKLKNLKPMNFYFSREGLNDTSTTFFRYDRRSNDDCFTRGLPYDCRTNREILQEEPNKKCFNVHPCKSKTVDLLKDAFGEYFRKDEDYISDQFKDLEITNQE